MKPFWKTHIKKWGIWNTIGNTAGGDNKAGEAIHGVLDLMPIPNQPIGKLIKAVTKGNWTVAKEELGKILTARNAVSIGVSIAVVMGWITLEDVKNFFGVIGEVTKLFNEFL